MQFQPPPGNQPPVYPREDDWGGARHAHKRIDELEDKLTGMMTDVAVIKGSMLTEDKLLRLLDRDRREESTYRRFEDDRIAQLRGYPAEQREERGVRYQSIQAHSSQMQGYLAILSLALSPILSLIVTHVLK